MKIYLAFNNGITPFYHKEKFYFSPVFCPLIVLQRHEKTIERTYKNDGLFDIGTVKKHKKTVKRRGLACKPDGNKTIYSICRL